MPPRREPRQPAESSFLVIAQLGEAIVSAIQTAFRTPHRTPLETIHHLKLTHFMGNEGHKGAEKWLNHVEKTFQGVFKERFQKRFIPLAYIDLKKQEFTHLRQGKMSANEYYRMFTDLSRYDLEASENMPSESEDKEGKNGGQRRDDKGKRQAFQGPRKTQNFKRSGGSSSSSSGGLSTNMQRRGGRFTGGPRFERQRDFGDSGGSGAPLCRRCNNQHFGECRKGNNECFTYGQMGHRAAQCPQSQQRPQQPSFPPPAPTQHALRSGGYTQTGRESAYHYQGDTAPYTSGQQQYSQDPQYQSGYPQFQGGSMSSQPHSAGES
ncbi:unnamed protein product [Malus baccata var. baccata]